MVAEYYSKDHLGNVRAAFTDRNGDGLVQLLATTSGPAEVNQTIDYYPFGLQYPGQDCRPVTDPENRCLYNGKEFSEELGLYDYGTRWYDPSIARWGQVDPLADDYTPFSPYNYVLNNPINMIDPDGRSADWIKTENDDGSVTYTAEQGDSAESLEEQHGVPFELGNEIIQSLFGPNVKSDKPEGRSNIHPADEITLVALKDDNPAEQATSSSGSNRGGLFIQIGDFLSGFLPNRATSSSEGDQQQHSGDSFTIYAVGSRKGWSINAPTADPNGSNRAIDITDAFPAGGGLPVFMNPFKATGNLTGKVGNAIKRARNRAPGNSRVKVCSVCKDTLPLNAPKGVHIRFDTIKKQ